VPRRRYRNGTSGCDARNAGREAGILAERHRCAADAAVECMAVQPEAVRPLATKTPFGMAIIPQRLLLKGALWLR
jgi:hypothetical protein